MAAKLLGDTKISTAAMELWVALSDDSHVFLARLERVPGWDGSRGEPSLAPAVRARLHRSFPRSQHARAEVEW